MKFYFTFGSAHYHEVNGKILDSQTIAVVEAEDEGKARKKFSDAFGLKWSHTYLDPEDAGKTQYKLKEVELTDEDLEAGKVARDELMADQPISIHWFSHSRGTLGIVIKKDKTTGEIKAYIASVIGHSKEDDVKYILEWGSKVTLERFETIVEQMKGS